jgi:sterol desaturase/sphingolipid hydroxylase (fatty acid hydroxylase superfamily)
MGTLYEVLVAALGILAINMTLQHCNVDYKSGFLKHIFSVADLHRWHHRAEYKDAQVNYGAGLIIWDRMFGTYYNDPKMYREIGEIGIKEEPNFPKNYVDQFLYPFKQ